MYRMCLWIHWFTYFNVTIVLFPLELSKALIFDHAGFQALSQFGSPKQTLNNLLQSSQLPNSNRLIRYETRQVRDLHQTILRLKWPQEIAVAGLGRRKVDSERSAAALACVQLVVNNVFSESLHIAEAWTRSEKVQCGSLLVFCVCRVETANLNRMLKFY